MIEQPFGRLGSSSRPTSSYPNSFFQRSMWYHTPSIQPVDPQQSITAEPRGSVTSTNPQSAIPLTVSLLESQPFALVTATEPPFLLAAGQGKLSKLQLSKWLSQARLVTQAQLSLLGALIARVDLPYVHMSNEVKATSIRWRIVNILSHAMQLTHQDLAFITSAAQRYELDLEYAPRPDVYFTADLPTKQIIDFFRAFWTDPTMSLLEGMVLFWSTLHCQLTSWQCVGKDLDPSYRGDLDGGAVRQNFVPYWTSVEFERFVAEVADVTNLLAEREEAWMKITVFKAIWQHVLDIEKRLWPAM